jgi:hypothetical protein
VVHLSTGTRPLLSWPSSDLSSKAPHRDTLLVISLFKEHPRYFAPLPVKTPFVSAGSVAQVVEHLLSKHSALASSPNTGCGEKPFVYLIPTFSFRLFRSFLFVGLCSSTTKCLGEHTLIFIIKNNYYSLVILIMRITLFHYFWLGPTTIFSNIVLFFFLVLEFELRAGVLVRQVLYPLSHNPCPLLL